MNPKPAAHSESNFTDVQSVSLISNLLTKHGFVMPNLTVVDKWPNIDGRVEVQNERGELIGPISVQAKTLGSGHKLKLECPVSFLSYCEIEPCLLLGVDNNDEKVYWFYFDAEIVKGIDFKNNKRTKTLHFDASCYFDKTATTYIKEWTKLVENNKQRLKDYDGLKRAYETILNNSNKTVGLSDSKFAKIHRFIDELNKSYENDFPTVKHFFYPNTWKLGIAYSSYESQTIGYTLYPIPYEKNDVQIKEIDQKFGKKFEKEGLGFTGHFVENPIEDRPAEYAKSIAGSQVSKLVEKKLLKHTGNDLLAREFVFAFIDEFHEQLGLPVKDKYSISEVQFGFYQYLPHWIEVAYALMLKEERNNIHQQLAQKGYFDPDILWQLKPVERKEIQQKVNQSWEKSASVNIASQKLDVGVFIEFFNYLKRTKQSIARVYKKSDFSRLEDKGGLVWNKYSIEDAEYNFKQVISGLQGAYETVRSNNFPTLSNELDLFGEADKILIQFTVRDAYQGHDTGPTYQVYYIQYDALTSEKTIELIDDKQAKDLEELIFARPKVERGVGIGFKLVSASHSALDFLYQDTPLLNLVYELMGRRLKEYFGK